MMQLLWIHQILLVRFFLGGKGGGGGGNSSFQIFRVVFFCILVSGLGL